MASVTFTEIETYEVITICDCGFKVGLPAEWLKHRRMDGRNFWCPACGCRRAYTKGPSESDKLKQELANVKQQLGWAQDARQRVATEAEFQKRRAAAAHPEFVANKDNADEMPSVDAIEPDKPLSEQVVPPKRGKGKGKAKNAQCPHCAKLYRNKATLKQHVERMHPSVSPGDSKAVEE